MTIYQEKQAFPCRSKRTSGSPNHFNAEATAIRKIHRYLAEAHFHRLDIALRQTLVDYLKELADTTSQTKKIAIVGISPTGQTLIDASFDLATRVDIFTLDWVKDNYIQKMIEKGEEALNIRFDRKAKIVQAASGSLSLAQFLCFNLCTIAGIKQTQERMQVVDPDMETAIGLAITDLKQKFEQPIKHFLSIEGPRDMTSLRLLEELALTKDGFLSLPLLVRTRRDLAQSLVHFLEEDWMGQLYHQYPEAENYLFFDPIRMALIIDDPL